MDQAPTAPPRRNRKAANAPPRAGALATVVRSVSLCVSIAIALGAAEIGMRLVGYSPAYVNAMGSFHQPDLVTGHRGKRNFQGRFKTPQFDVLVAHNDEGFRRQEYQNPLSASSRRMFVFGDSFVWGWGVDQGEPFTDCLSRRLPEWHIKNLGINGTGTVAQYELFASECRDQLQTQDVVLLTFFGNDFADNVEGARRGEVVDGKVVILPVDPRAAGLRHAAEGIFVPLQLSGICRESLPIAVARTARAQQGGGVGGRSRGSRGAGCRSSAIRESRRQGASARGVRRGGG